MSEECLFCKIASGEIPSYKVWEDEKTFAFLDATPTVDGHVLVVPKKHSENIFDVPRESLYEVIVTVQKVVRMLKDNLGAKGINIMNNTGEVAGQKVFHLHFQVIPRYENDGRSLHLFGEKNINTNFEEIANKITGGKK